MNKTAIIVLVIVVLGGIWWFVSSQDGTTAPTATSTPVASTGTPMSMRELWAKGGSVACTFASTENNQTVSGMMYLANGKMRGDFEVKGTGAGTMESHMISDGKEMWTWSSAMPQGVRMMMPTEGQTQAGAQQTVDWDKKADYKCSSWTADSAKFALPSGVKFMDLNAMMPKAQ